MNRAHAVRHRTWWGIGWGTRARTGAAELCGNGRSSSVTQSLYWRATGPTPFPNTGTKSRRSTNTPALYRMAVASCCGITKQCRNAVR